MHRSIGRSNLIDHRQAWRYRLRKWIFPAAFAFANLGLVASAEAAQATLEPVANDVTVEPSIETLITQLGDQENSEASRAAAYALGQRRGAAAAAVPALAECLTSKDLQLCWYAADALGRIGPRAAPAIPALVREIENPANLDVFPVVAIRALGQIGQAKGVIPLLLKSSEHEDPNRRIAAGLALWQIDQDRRGIATLISVATQATPEPALLANVTLLQVDELTDADFVSLLPALRNGDADVRLAAARVVGRSGLRIFRDLTSLLDSSNHNERLAATWALIDIVDGVRETVLYSEATSAEEFLAAARPLVVLAAPKLLPQLNEPSSTQRSAVERALAKMGPLVLGKVIPLLADQGPQGRDAALGVLQRMQRYFPDSKRKLPGLLLVKKSVAKPISAALSHENIEIRKSAVRVLAVFPLPEYRQQLEPLLRLALREENLQIRRDASSALSALKDSGQP